MTALAVAFSWLGVRGVVRSAVSERSAPPPIAGPVIHSSPTTPPGPATVGSPTARPRPPDGADTAPKPSKSAKPPPGKPEQTPKTPDNVRSYATRGGRAAMSIERNRVRLVSATPNPGYETRVTQAEGWLRVDFLSDEHTSSVIASWYEHAPIVKVYEY
ncbi:hypothetical protein [Actinomadura latina]|uniref:Secreted protein n=1 Tax=Actinomadura latina TaxID=163603 RepID=A0A846Z6X7_9ACTN|nr:hypothetical protein [Actinomadura latina]NKZ05906.1 hypothetical protein [Actinomadura latina]